MFRFHRILDKSFFFSKESTQRFTAVTFHNLTVFLHFSTIFLGFIRFLIIFIEYLNPIT